MDNTEHETGREAGHETKRESVVISAIAAWEKRFTVRTKDGLCIDWMAGSKSSHEEFVCYLRMRQWLRSIAITKGI